MNGWMGYKGTGLRVPGRGFRVLAVDPGVETGGIVAHWDSEKAMVDSARRLGPLRAIRELGAAGGVDLKEWLASDPFVSERYRGRFGEVGIVREMLVDVWSSNVLVIEDFILRRSEKSRDLLSPVRIASMLEMEWVALKGNWSSTLVWQDPNMKTSFPDESLRRAGLWVKSSHICDAIRHLAIYLSSRVNEANQG